jgi:hypothetical protein
MDIGVYSIKDLSDADMGKLIDDRRSFVLEDIARTNMGEAVESLEKCMEARGLRCRVYTKGRSASMAAAAIPTPVTVLGGWASAVAIGAHNLATWNPDYEIAKNLAMGTLTVNYKK